MGGLRTIELLTGDFFMYRSRTTGVAKKDDYCQDLQDSCQTSFCKSYRCIERILCMEAFQRIQKAKYFQQPKDN